jgi:hypothetical protein
LAAEDVAVRNQVLNEVLDAFQGMDGNKGMEDILGVIQSLKQKQKAQSGF